MANNRSRSHRQSSKVAFCGLMAALSVALMLMGGIIPVATYCVPMASAALLLPVLLEYGKKAAWTMYAAVALITLVLGVDKEAAFFYLFLGYYPLLKWEIERVVPKKLRLPCKLLLFNGAIALMYMALGFLLNMQAVVEEFSQMGMALLVVFMILLNVCMLLYDRLMYPLVFLYDRRIKPKLRFLR